jgi:hypothetical protein
MRRRTRARHFGDNPRVRHSFREHQNINLDEPWERRYAGIKKTSSRVRGYVKTVKRRRVRVRGHVRRY